MYKSSAFDLFNYAAMHTHCPHCNLKFEVEPGFFYGAMFVSYAIAVATIGVCFTIVYLLFGNPETWVYMTVICAIIVLMMPLNFRYSRTLMLHLFGGVDFVGTK
jgi:uncharacterized protein (DUF983 family)